MRAIHPGSTIGIVGGGQLARMIALEARRMGYRVAVIDPTEGCPAAQVPDLHIPGQIDDLTAERALADRSDVITIDSEHVPAALLQDLESRTLVRPGAGVLWKVQDRLRQRRFLESCGLPQPAHAPIGRAADITAASAAVGFPAVLKTRTEGYDGKGLSRVESIAQLHAAWKALEPTPCTLEAFVPFEKEISAILARDPGGDLRFYAVAENRHRNHILHTAQVLASITQELVAHAEEIGGLIAAALDHVGMMAVELFVTHDDELLVNEVAPGTHNIGE